MGMYSVTSLRQCTKDLIGSLAAVIADAIRYQLINNELEFALLPSAFQFSTASFLWSQGFLATLRQPPYPLRKVAFLFLLIICILLGAIAGPASALLFIPTQGWLDAGSTDFYLRGSESDLWPQHLTTDLIAPECLGSRLSLSVKCPGGGWEGVREGYHYAGADEDWRWDTFALDHKDPRIIHTFDHRNSNSSHDYGVWSIAPHLATANVATLVHDHHNKAWLHATGMKRKIRDAGVWMAITDGKHPVVRTSCGPNVQVTGEDIKLPFPIIKDYIWNMETGFKQWDIKAEWILPKSNESLPRDDTTILHTTWVAPPEGNGEATAGLIVALVNDTTTVVRACAIDARWSGGAIEVHHGSYLNSYLTHLDTQLPPKELLFGMPYYRLPPPEGANSTLSKTITADPGWVESIAPHTVQEIHGIEGSITNFEEMLLYTWSGTMYFNLDKTNDRRGALFLEYASHLHTLLS